MQLNMKKLQEYKPEITFLIDKQAKIYYHKIDLFHDHEDLINENKVREFDVCRLVYDPNSEDVSFCGIPGISASMNQLYDALPFELKSTHLNAIENWVKQYTEIVKYAEEHHDEYDPDMTFEFVRAMNRIKLASMGEKFDSSYQAKYNKVATEYKKWKNRLPELKYLDDEEEIDRLFEANLLGQFFNDEEGIREYKADLYDRAQEAYKLAALEKTNSMFDEKAIKTNVKYDESGKEIGCSMKVKMHIDLARFIEVTSEVIQESGYPAALYFAIGGKLLYDVITKIAERAIELNDETLLDLLERLKIVEKGEDE